MLSIKTLIFAACAALALVAAQEDTFDPTKTQIPEPRSRQIRVQVEFFEIDALDALKLQSDSKLAAKDALLRTELIKRVEDGSAKLLAGAMLSSRSGETATSENIAETIYPTDYEGYSMPSSITLAEGNEDLMLAPPKPTAFQTRNVGLVIEMEPTIRKNSLNEIDLRFAPELVFEVDDEIYSTWKTERSESSVKMPTFYTLRVNTSLVLKDGVPYLAALLTPKDDTGKLSADKRVFLFVTASIRTAGDE